MFYDKTNKAVHCPEWVTIDNTVRVTPENWEVLLTNPFEDVPFEKKNNVKGRWEPGYLAANIDGNLKFATIDIWGSVACPWEYPLETIVEETEQRT